MTIIEFNDYFKSFNKEAGDFTKDEIYELGKTFKQVVGKKRWQYLADLVGWENGECLRSYIKNRNVILQAFGLPREFILAAAHQPRLLAIFLPLV